MMLVYMLLLNEKERKNIPNKRARTFSCRPWAAGKTCQVTGQD